VCVCPFYYLSDEIFTYARARRYLHMHLHLRKHILTFAYTQSFSRTHPPRSHTSGVVFAYIAADVGFLAKGLHDRNAEPAEMRRTITHALVFHSIASLALPTVIIHTAVKQS
jgi:hypothetical protein